MEPLDPLATILARYGGHRALIVDDGAGTYRGSIARRFEQVDVVSFDHDLSSSRRRRESLLNLQETTWQDGPLPYADATFDAAFVFHALPLCPDWRRFLRELLRTVRQRGPVVIVEYGTSARTEQQAAQIELERLLYDRDAALRGQTFEWITPDDLRKELRLLDVHHLRVVEIAPEDRLDAVDRAALKREALDRIKLDLLPALGRLGERRDEFERRLVELKRRIEISGVMPAPLMVLHGIKKTVYSAVGTPLFAGEVFAPGAAADPASGEALTAPTTPQAESIESLPLAQLLSLVMSDGESATRFERLAQRILRDYGSRAVAQEGNARTLADSLGISPARASQIVAAFELGRRFFTPPGDDAPVLRGPEDAVQHAADMRALRREQFRGLYLNNRQKLVADEVISIGTLTNAILHPREVFRPALTHHAVSLILIHNHPSGDPEPSPEDIEMTRQLHRAGQILGIELLDHVIIAADSWFSMKNANLI
ncbi:MAG: DNA repair protein RadC [bacterium]|nr:DNA repair protein RadC [bacterium]